MIASPLRSRVVPGVFLPIQRASAAFLLSYVQPMIHSRRLLGLFLSLSAAGIALAKDFLPAVVYDFGGKFDRSFNQSASEGAERFKKDTGIAFREFEVSSAAQREQAMTQLAKRGASIIAAIGFTQASAVEKV